MIGRIYLGQYSVVKLLGEGNMGKVYLARRKSDSQPVVVKVMHDHLCNDPKFRELFAKEMQFMARFKHPNVIELYDSSPSHAPNLCIVMEYAEGTDLEHLLLKHKKFPVERVGTWLGQLCSALQAAHQHGIIHRDLKPANLMVVEPDKPTEKIKVMDFGLAKLSTSVHISLDKLKGSNSVIATGTPEYIAPEQVRGDELDHRSDLYAVGVILFELLTGKLPFSCRTIEETLRAHADQPPPKFAAVGAAGLVPATVEAVVMRCLSKYPVERPRDAWELGTDFEKALGRKILVGPKPEPPRPAETQPIIRKPVDPNAVVHELEAWMPEPIAVVKLRGFVDDMHGQVVESLPGKILVHLGQSNCKYQMPGAPRPAPVKSGGLGAWFGKSAASEPKPAGKLIELELLMEKKSGAAGTMLHITVTIRPQRGPMPRTPEWHSLCDQIFKDLRGYLITK